MSQLHPCHACSRHVRAAEEACPFCGAALATESSRARPGGKLTRAAIFAGALASATAVGCGPQQTQANQPPPPPPMRTADAGTPPAPPPDAAFAKEPPPATADASVPVRILPNKPYGAPPARHRLV